jgi:acyl-CoA dehydrogenase
MIVPKELGGLGFSPYAVLQVVSKISSHSPTAAVIVMVPNSLGPAELVLHYGTPEQKLLIPQLANGQLLPCFGLTSDKAGSDAASMVDKAIVVNRSYTAEDGSQRNEIGLELTVSKRYITLAPVADIIGLAVKVYDPERLLEKSVDGKIALLIVPRNTPGLEIGNVALPLNAPFPNGTIRCTNMPLSMDSVIGGVDGLDKGWFRLIDRLVNGRAISLVGLSIGAGKLVTRAVGAYSAVREQFNLPLGVFEGIQEPLARIAAYTFMIDSAGGVNAGAMGRLGPSAVLASILKYHSTELMRKVVNDGMDVLGGKGIMQGPRNFLAKYYFAAPIAITVEGANILGRTLMIFGQGVNKCHPFLLKEIFSARDFGKDETVDPELLSEFDEAFFGHIAYAGKNVLRGIVQNGLGIPLMDIPADEPSYLVPYYQEFSRLSNALSVMSEMVLVHLGGDIKRKETLSARLGDMLSYLFIASCVLRRYRELNDEDFLPVVEWSLDECLYQIKTALDRFVRNYPSLVLRMAARGFTQPWSFINPFGRTAYPPSDKLTMKVAGLITKPGKVRDVLTEGIYLSDSLDNPVAMLDYTLVLVTAVQGSLKKIRQAVKSGQASGLNLVEQAQSACENGVISESELRAFLEAQLWRERCIQVDEFESLEPRFVGKLATPPIEYPRF